MKKTLMTAVLLAALPAAGMAQSLPRDYTFVEGGYQYVDPKGSGHADGGYLKGSYEFDGGLYAFGSASRVSTGGFDLDTYDAGLGYRHAISSNVDVLGEAAWVRERIQDFGHADGYRVGAGVKAGLGRSFEGTVKANYYDGSDLISQWSGVIGGRYALSPQWSVTGEAEYFDKSDFTTYRIGARYSF